MKTRKLNFLVYVHGALLLWAALFVISLSMSDGGQTASRLAFGNLLFLFVNIPLGILCLIFSQKNRFDAHYKVPAIVLSMINMLIGSVAWIFAAMLLEMP